MTKNRGLVLSLALVVLGALAIGGVFLMEPRSAVVFELPRDAAALEQYQDDRRIAMAVAAAGVLLVGIGCALALRRARRDGNT